MSVAALTSLHGRPFYSLPRRLCSDRMECFPLQAVVKYDTLFDMLLTSQDFSNLIRVMSADKVF